MQALRVYAYKPFLLRAVSNIYRHNSLNPYATPYYTFLFLIITEVTLKSVPEQLLAAPLPWLMC